MSLADLIYSKRKKAAANANPANPESVHRVADANVSKISNFSISKAPEAEAANDPRTLPDECRETFGALAMHGGGVIPWQADAESVTGTDAALRAELARLSDRVASALQWDDDERAWLADYAARCPASSLAADVAAYRAQVAALDAEQAARDAMRRAHVQ